MSAEMQCDGIHGMAVREKMDDSARKIRDIYALKPGIPFYRQEFGFYCLERWKEQGLPENANLAQVFHYDPPGKFYLERLGWVVAALVPEFEVKILENRGDHEVVQDQAGRKVLYFKGRRDGFMPEYLDHPVKDEKTWRENVKWRLDPADPQRYIDLETQMAVAREAAGRGLMISQTVIGGYMYLRSLMGPEELLYKFHDNPKLVHDCMQMWLKLADAVIARHQDHLTLDELFLAEDICYNHGPLISPDMIREFLFPYYQQLIRNVKSRQLDRSRHLYTHIDTDGFAVPVIGLYQQGIGMDAMSPFEVASGCDVVQIGRQFPNLAIFGGIDKRVLAKDKTAIDRHLEYILPAMRTRGGYIPTCDHGVPEEVSLENYLHYRKRCLELGG